MTDKRNDIVGTNIDIAASKVANGIINNSPYSTPQDKIKSLLTEVRDRHQNVEPDEYFGYCLYSDRWTIAKFQSLFPPESKFYKDVVFAKNKKKPEAGATILCCRVHIPEITGVLPFPELGMISKLTELFAEGNLDNPKAKKRLSRAVSLASPQVAKIDLQPRFFMYSKENIVIPMGQLCKIKFLKDCPTRGLGIFLEMLDANISDCGGEE